uniref:Retrotransposon gag domain-containing protein n=1 Tax=Fagus sylvatica TaxID=28930 RepID=A0A2N9FKF0_FAGSY
MTRIPVKENQEGHSNTNATPPRPPTPPKPEGERLPVRTARLIVWRKRSGSYRAPEFEKYNGRGDPMIHLQMYCRKMAPYADNEPLLIQTFQDTLTGNAAEWYSQLKKISHWKELADTFLAQYGFNSQNSSGSGSICRGWRRRAMKPSGTEQAAKKAPTKKKEGDVQMIGRSNGRPRQVLPTFTMQPIQPRPIQAPAPSSGSQPRPEHPSLKGLPNITTNPLPNHPEGGVNMVEIEEGRMRRERIAWRRLFYTLEKQRHITPLDAPPGPSTGDACEYHSGARGHRPRMLSIWMTSWKMRWISITYKDEGADWGYFMEDDTDEWRDVDFTKFFQFPCLIVPPGFVTPEFEIFYEEWGSGGPFAKVRREDGLTFGE